MFDPQEYGLGYIQTPTDVRNRFKSIREAAPVLSRDKWKPIDRRTELGTQFINNQKRTSGCVGWSSAQAFMRCRALAGMTFQKLSGAFIYAGINGNRDSGANIGDALTRLMRDGTCLESEADVNEIFMSRIPASAKQTAMRFKVEEGYRVDSFDEALSALQLGFILVYPCMVGSNFYNLDNEDIVGTDRGGGNHSIHADGCYLSKGGVWCLDAANSWSVDFGNQGRMRTTEKQFNMLDMDAYAIRVPSVDPQDPKQPPAVQ